MDGQHLQYPNHANIAVIYGDSMLIIAYITGYGIKPLEMTNPPKTKISSRAKDPNVFETTSVLPTDAMKRKSDKDI